MPDEPFLSGPAPALRRLAAELDSVKDPLRRPEAEKEIFSGIVSLLVVHAAKDGPRPRVRAESFLSAAVGTSDLLHADPRSAPAAIEAADGLIERICAMTEPAISALETRLGER